MLVPIPDAPEILIDTPVIPRDRARTQVDPLGTGITRPFRRDQQQDFATASGAALVKACVGQVLGTIGSSPDAPGELPWNPDFGSQLQRVRNANETVAAEIGRVYVVDAIRRWEPRARVSGASVSTEEISGKLALVIRTEILISPVGGGPVEAGVITRGI